MNGVTQVRNWRRCAGSVALAGIFLAGICSGDTANCTAPGGDIGTFTIDSQATADTLSNCSTFIGNIAIQGNDLTQLTLNGITAIEGDFSAGYCDGLQAIVAPTLSRISGSFAFSTDPLLESLEFPLLTNIGRGIVLNILPKLANVSFSAAVDYPYALPGAYVDGDVSISETALTNLTFMKFGDSQDSPPAMFSITGNQQLSNITFVDLAKVSKSMEIVNNGPSAQISFPALRYLGNLTISNASLINLPTLYDTTGTVEITYNDMDNFTTWKSLSVGGDLIITDNHLLKDLSLSVVYVSNLVVANNTALNTITNSVYYCVSKGNVTFSGDFTNASFSTSATVQGSLRVNSSNAALDCTALDKLASKEEWYSSHYSCAAYVSGSTEDVAKHYQAPDTNHISKTGKIIAIVVSIVVGLPLCALVVWYFNRPKKTSQSTPAGEAVRAGSEVVTADGDGGIPLEDRPPIYRKVGKPGEVLPGYTEDNNGSTSSTSREAEVPHG